MFAPRGRALRARTLADVTPSQYNNATTTARDAMDVVIAIGHDGAGKNFAGQVTKVIRLLGTLNAVVEGQSWSPEWGAEQASWFAASFPDFDTYVEARARILAIGGAHNQDAVAFTVGTVDVADCPKPNKRVYRDLL